MDVRYNREIISEDEKKIYCIDHFSVTSIDVTLVIHTDCVYFGIVGALLRLLNTSD